MNDENNTSISTTFSEPEWDNVTTINSENTESEQPILHKVKKKKSSKKEDFILNMLKNVQTLIHKNLLKS